MPKLTIKSLCKEANLFSAIQSRTPEKVLYGVTDGKAVGTYLEQKCREYLKSSYNFIQGNSANEIINNPPELGFLTISNALQWRLQYSRVIERAGVEQGILAVYRANK